MESGTFLEGIKALQDGECDKINNLGNNAFILDGWGRLKFNDCYIKEVFLDPSIYLGVWKWGKKKINPIEAIDMEYAITKVEKWRDEALSVSPDEAARAVAERRVLLKVTKLLESIRDNNL